MNLGVLAVQGDWLAHSRVLQQLGFTASPVRTPGELAQVDGMIVPGGESTAMLRLMEPEDLVGKITERISQGMPILAVCAGLILLARNVTPVQSSLGVLDVDVTRNAYGRQVHSTVAPIDVNGDMGDPKRMEGVFIRAPRITRAGAGVQVLGRFNDEPVLVRSGHVMGTTFHPELTSDQRVHRMFCELVEVSHG